MNSGMKWVTAGWIGLPVAVVFAAEGNESAVTECDAPVPVRARLSAPVGGFFMSSVGLSIYAAAAGQIAFKA